MFKIRHLALILSLLAAPVTAQTDTSMVVISKSLLTAQQVEAANQQAKIETYGKYVGLGKEVGEAVNSSLEAVTEQTSKFADTNVGKFTMAIIAWKVLGQDALAVVFSAVMIFIGVPILVWSYRHYLPTRTILVKTETVDKTKIHTYKLLREMHTESDQLATGQILHLIGAVFIVLCIAIALFTG